jgi:hypothetical protein
MTPAPNRRWLRFSLRSLFVAVTLLAMALGWRSYCLAWIQARRDVFSVAPGTMVGSTTGTAPGLLWIWGERGYDRLRVRFRGEVDEQHLSPEQRAALQQIRRVYSEANVEVVPPYPGVPI